MSEEKFMDSGGEDIKSFNFSATKVSSSRFYITQYDQDAYALLLLIDIINVC